MMENLPGRGKSRCKAMARSKSKACLGDVSSVWLEHGSRRACGKRHKKRLGKPGEAGF